MIKCGLIRGGEERCLAIDTDDDREAELMNKFFVVLPDKGMRFGTKWTYGEVMDPVVYGDSQNCPKCGGPVSMLKWLPPHFVKLSSAKPQKWSDFVWGAGFKLIISERFKEIYQLEGLKGIESFSKVRVVRIGAKKTGEFPVPPPNYYLPSIAWGGADQDDVASEIRYEHPEEIKCNYCRVGVAISTQEKVIIREGSWDGSDIFIPIHAPVLFMVSERFKQIEEEYDFTNIWLIPSEKFGYSGRMTHFGHSWHISE